MNKDKIKNILQNYATIENALLFGSYASNTAHNMSDVDIAIQTSEELDIFEIGEIIAVLESHLGKKIDFILLNELYKKSPLLAYNIYKNHLPLFIKNREKYNYFKESALHYYLDFKHVIDAQNEAFNERIANGNLAKTQTTLGKITPKDI
ncbi:type VII toxin-antitoxin system MntA family adenylyltransferase antitoxin [Sulfurimonas sp.]